MGRDVMESLGGALMRLAYPALVEARIASTDSVFALVGLAMHVLLWKFAEKNSKSAVKGAGRKKKGSVAFPIDRTGIIGIFYIRRRGCRR
jgi:hypothetical protein